MKVRLLVYRGHEVMGEYPVNSTVDSVAIARDALTKLKPELSGVILGEYGLLAHSANLPKDNPRYNELVLHV